MVSVSYRISAPLGWSALNVWPTACCTAGLAARQLIKLSCGLHQVPFTALQYRDPWFEFLSSRPYCLRLFSGVVALATIGNLLLPS